MFKNIITKYIRFLLKIRKDDVIPQFNYSRNFPILLRKSLSIFHVWLWNVLSVFSR